MTMFKVALFAAVICVVYSAYQPRYPRWGRDFKWSYAGKLSHKHYECVSWNEPSSPSKNTWRDNYLCWKKSRYMRSAGLKWSIHGKIPGMSCTRIFEDSAPASHTWCDNYLCWPKDAPYDFYWSRNGPVRCGMSCLQILEPSDPHTWKDNYLCN